LKKDLWDVIKASRTPPEYVVDKIAEEKGDFQSIYSLMFYTMMIGHEVVQLPVAHCELNPIEMAWSQVKGHVKELSLYLYFMLLNFISLFTVIFMQKKIYVLVRVIT